MRLVFGALQQFGQFTVFSMLGLWDVPGFLGMAALNKGRCMSFNKKSAVVGAATVAAGFLIAWGAYIVGFSGEPLREGPVSPPAKAADAN